MPGEEEGMYKIFRSLSLVWFNKLRCRLCWPVWGGIYHPAPPKAAGRGEGAVSHVLVHTYLGGGNGPGQAWGEDWGDLPCSRIWGELFKRELGNSSSNFLDRWGAFRRFLLGFARYLDLCSKISYFTVETAPVVVVVMYSSLQNPMMSVLGWGWEESVRKLTCDSC